VLRNWRSSRTQTKGGPALPDGDKGHEIPGTAGTQIDGTNPQWRGTPLPSVMPISAQALDAAALNAVNNWYSGMPQWFVMKGF